MVRKNYKVMTSRGSRSFRTLKSARAYSSKRKSYNPYIQNNKTLRVTKYRG